MVIVKTSRSKIVASALNGSVSAPEEQSFPELSSGSLVSGAGPF